MGEKTETVFVEVSERDVDFLLLEEMECDSNFRAWLLAKIGAAGNEILRLHRSAATFRGESDLLFVHKGGDGGCQAVLIENKIAAAFAEYQPARYRARGEDGVKGGEWDSFVTVIMAPRRRLAVVPSDAFDFQISYEEIQQAMRGMGPRAAFKRRMLAAACAVARKPWARVPDRDITSWFKQARELAAVEFASLPLPSEHKAREPTDTLMALRLPSYSRVRLVIEIRPALGTVDLLLKRVTVKDLRHAVGRHFPAEIKIEPTQAGRSTRCRTAHPPADVRSGFPGQEAMLRPMFESARVLMQFCQDYGPSMDLLLGPPREGGKTAALANR